MKRGRIIVTPNSRSSPKRNPIVTIDRTGPDKIGVFISYNRVDKEHLNNLINNLKKNGIEQWHDEHIEDHDDNFIATIHKKILESRVGVLICTKNALESKWITYEIGLFKGLKKPVVCFFPTKKDKKAKPSILREYECADNYEELVGQIKKLFHYRDWLSSKTINSGKLGSAELCLTFGTKTLKKEHLRFGCLIVTLSRYGDRKKTNEEKCLFTGKQRVEKRCTKSDNGHDCAWLADIDLDEFPDVIIQNQIIEGTIHDIDDSGTWQVKYILPIPDNYGLTFKCFVDVLNEDYVNNHHIMKILSAMDKGFSKVDLSASAEGNRIYFLLNEDIEQHLICIQDKFVPEITNNYLCPRCLMLKSSKQKNCM